MVGKDLEGSGRGVFNDSDPTLGVTEDNSVTTGLMSACSTSDYCTVAVWFSALTSE